MQIEEKINKKLEEFAVPEQEALRHLNETTLAKTKADMVFNIYFLFFIYLFQYLI